MNKGTNLVFVIFKFILNENGIPYNEMKINSRHER